jgi:dTDP-4-amino-4,6-dideoxygalactose transaminase
MNNTSKWTENPGCMSSEQIRVLSEALQKVNSDPSLFSGIEGTGPVADLEQAFALVCGTKYALALSSGTAAIHAALLATGTGPGDEVIVTPYSWPQSVDPVFFTGAKAVFADIDPETFNLDPDSVTQHISPRTKAIVPVHLFGNPADMIRLEQIAGNAGAVLIADGAHAIGATLKDRPVGVWGNVTCFSLGRGKTVTGGEGGMLVTNNKDLYDKAVALTQHPIRYFRIKGEWPAKQPCHNYRIHPLAALLALCDLKTVDNKLHHKKLVYSGFMEGLGETSCIKRQVATSQAKPAAYGIPLTLAGDINREKFVFNLQNQGVPLRCGPVGIPLHLRFDSAGIAGAFPVSERRCFSEELWALSSMDMDAVSHDEAFIMGEKIRKLKF